MMVFRKANSKIHDCDKPTVKSKPTKTSQKPPRSPEAHKNTPSVGPIDE